MSITAKQYLDMIAADLGEMFPGAAVSTGEDGEKAVLSAGYTLPGGKEIGVMVTLIPTENNMLGAQVIADLTAALPPEITDGFIGKISEINNEFTYGSVIFDPNGNNRYCIYNYGFYIDTGLDLKDITVILGRSIADAELEFCSGKVIGLFGADQDAQG